MLCGRDLDDDLRRVGRYCRVVAPAFAGGRVYVYTSGGRYRRPSYRTYSYGTYYYPRRYYSRARPRYYRGYYRSYYRPVYYYGY